MKYGQQLEHESVPEWSLHNLDYNSLKHEIKVHTTRQQATAMAIPGQEDSSLRRFEDGLYQELLLQHDRLNLFVTSKADEISRRMEHLAGNLQRWIARTNDPRTPQRSLKQHRKFVRHERELLRCGDDIRALTRFVKAQVVAFRKILKKYKKWTGSITLGSRFTHEILAHPKSFTRRDFAHLQSRYDEISNILQDATPQMSEPSSPSSDERPFFSRPSSSRTDFEPLPPPQMGEQIKYWNEYDNGSECGGDDDVYAIYINPDDSGFPGLHYVQTAIEASFAKAKSWLRIKPDPERQALLAGSCSPQASYSSTAVASDSEEEGYASSDGYPSSGYNALYALPSVSQQKLARYREKVFFWGTVGCFATAFLLLAVAGILISAGKHKLRVEVDAGVTVGVVASLFCACTALGMSMNRRDPLTVLHRLVVWTTFAALCILNGMLLILVVGNSP